MVEYQATAAENVYNLAFGDYDEMKREINDLSVTNNGDSLKVLATVAATVYDFLKAHKNAWIIATGSTAVRTRLYRMGITNNLDEISKDFFIFGFTDKEEWLPFIPNEDYSAFLIIKK